MTATATPDTEAKLRLRLSNTSKALALLSELCPLNREEGEALGLILQLLGDYCAEGAA